MQTHIAYDPSTGKILCFISCDYEINTDKVFANFDNYEVLTINEEMPSNYQDYIIENNELKLKEEEA